MKYVNLQRRWQQVGPYYRCETAKNIWTPEMTAYLYGRGVDYGFPWKYKPIESPAAVDSCDWRWGHGRRGPQPGYWEYVCHSACHWIVNLHLWVACHIESQTPWQIVSSDKHSTVWDGKDRLWDGNFLALGVEAKEAWKLAGKQKDSEYYLPREMQLHDVPAGVPQMIHEMASAAEDEARRLRQQYETAS